MMARKKKFNFDLRLLYLGSFIVLLLAFVFTAPYLATKEGFVGDAMKLVAIKPATPTVQAYTSGPVQVPADFESKVKQVLKNNLGFRKAMKDYTCSQVCALDRPNEKPTTHCIAAFQPQLITTANPDYVSVWSNDALGSSASCEKAFGPAYAEYDSVLCLCI